MTSLRVKLRLSLSGNRPGVVYYQIIHRRTARQIRTKFKVFPDDWEAINGDIAERGDEYLQTVVRGINEDLKCINEVIADLERRERVYSADDVVSGYRLRRGGCMFFTFMERIIGELRQARHSGTEKNYRSALCSFRQFRDNRDTPVADIDRAMMERYQTFLAGRGVSPNTVSFYMRVLRAVYNRAVDRESIPDKRPFRTVFTGVEKTCKRAISLPELRRIRCLDLSHLPALAFARDIFFFLFLCRGMSFVDAAYLRKADMRFGIITYRRRKTGQVLHVKVEKELRAIINRYKSKGSTYLLPIITDTATDERSQYVGVLRRINKGLKDVGAMADVSVPLTTYVSRHSWATIAKHKQVPISVISDALGHDSENTTKIYLASMDNTVIDNVNKLIIRELKPGADGQ